MIIMKNENKIKVESFENDNRRTKENTEGLNIVSKQVTGFGASLLLNSNDDL